MKKIPIAGPWVTDLEVRYTTEAAATAWYDRAGEWPARFEKTMADYIGVEHAICVPHCTAAIHLALRALGVGPGDEVIVPDATWIASVAPVTYVGAQPVFADVDPDTWCMTPESMAAVITPRTKAAIPVDLYGSMPDWAALQRVADAHGIALIEDSAEALGSEIDGKKAGSFGRAGVFSFHGSKTLTTGEGGMLVTNDTAIRDRALVMRDHGRPPGDRFFYNTEVAYKYRMSSLQAAFGTAQAERAHELVDKKRQIFGWYRDRLSGLPGVKLNAEPPGVKNSYWMSTIVLDPSYGLEKREFMALLLEIGADTRPFFHQLSTIPAFANDPEAAKARTRNTVSASICPYGINLPCALVLTEDDVDFVSSCIRKVLASRA
jgi:perosamine synthetase